MGGQLRFGKCGGNGPSYSSRNVVIRWQQRINDPHPKHPTNWKMFKVDASMMEEDTRGCGNTNDIASSWISCPRNKVLCHLDRLYRKGVPLNISRSKLAPGMVKQQELAQNSNKWTKRARQNMMKVREKGWSTKRTANKSSQRKRWHTRDNKALYCF